MNCYEQILVLLMKEKAIQKHLMKKEKKENSGKSLRSSPSSLDLQVVKALNEIFGTLLGQMAENKKMENKTKKK